MADQKPKLAIFKFSSCDGCQLSVLDLEEELLSLASVVDIAYFVEARRATEPGPYDIALVEGSVTTPEEVERIKEIRANTKFLIPFGVCATWGGVQAHRNFMNFDEAMRRVYPRPEAYSALSTSTPIWDHVKVDYMIQGCPPNRHQILEVLTNVLVGKKPALASHSVCYECKSKGNICVIVARGIPCLGVVTHDGCGALCPSYDRGCYGCFGPMDDPKAESTAKQWWVLGVKPADIVRDFRRITPYADGYNKGAEVYEREADQG